jgi:hypothetical protein
MTSANMLRLSEDVLTQITPWSRALLVKLIFAQPVKKPSTFKETESSLPCSLETGTRLYPVHNLTPYFSVNRLNVLDLRTSQRCL